MEQGKNVTHIENDIKTLHYAFLPGKTSVQLVQGLRVLVE